MKNLAVIILCFFSIVSQAQTNDFAPIGAKWYYTERYAFSGDIDYLSIESVKDTVIKGKTCHVLKNNGGLVCSYYSIEDYVYTEDSVVYFYVSQIDTFQVLYNYKAQKGDSWKVVFQANPSDYLNSITVNVDSVSFINLNGTKLIKQFITQESINGFDIFTYNCEIIEKIGDLNYLFNFQDISGLTCDANYSDGLRCYEDSSIYFNNNNIYPSCDYISLGKEHIIMNNSIEISPNPFQKTIFIKFNNVRVSKIEIYNLIGFTVFEKNTLRYKNQIELDLSNLISGVYIAKITTLDNKIALKKIVKM